MPVTRSASSLRTPPLNSLPLSEQSPRRGRGAKPPVPQADIIILSDLSDGEVTTPKRKSLGPSRKKATERQRTKAKAKPFVVIGDILEVSSDDDVSKSPKRSSTTVVNLQNQVKKLEDEITQLKHECSRLKRTFLLDVSTLEDHLTCDICTLNLWSPYILPECGHTFCQTCLQDWFRRLLDQHVRAHPHYNLNPNPPLQNQWNQAAHQLQPQYTCPSCRAEVKTKPAEEYALKAMIRTVAAARGERSPETKGAVARVGTAQLEGPWDKFFRKT